MIRIIDNCGTGKTKKLMLAAKEAQGVVVCHDPHAMKQKAIAYGITGVDFIDYIDFYAMYLKDTCKTPFFIDEIEQCIKELAFGFLGYTLTKED